MLGTSVFGLVAVAGVALAGEHDGPGPPNPEPDQVTNNEGESISGKKPEWSGEVEGESGTEKWYWEQDSDLSPYGGVDQVSVTQRGTWIRCWGNYFDGDPNNGAYPIDGGAKGSASYYEHAVHNTDDDLWWEAVLRAEFQTLAFLRGDASLTASGYVKAFGAKPAEYGYTWTGKGSVSVERTRVITTTVTTSAGVETVVDTEVRQQDGEFKDSAAVAAKLKAELSAAVEGEVTVTRRSSGSSSTTQVARGYKREDLRGSGDGCVFTANVSSMHHIDMSGDAIAVNSPSDIKVLYSNTYSTTPTVKFMKTGDEPWNFDPYTDGETEPLAIEANLEDGTEDVADGTVFRMDLQPGLGLDTEAGTRRGEVLVRIEEPLTTDLTLALSQSGTGSVDFASNSLTLEAGTTAAFTAFEITALGDTTIVATRLDANGVPTTFSLSGTVPGSSITSLGEPVVVVGWDAETVRTIVDYDSGDLWCRAESGEVLPPIVMRRSGFDDYDTEATTATVTLDDPDDILGNMPTQLVISAGAESASLPITTTGDPGRATITLTVGQQDHDVEIELVDLGWEANVPKIQVPENAEMVGVQVKLNVPEDSDRTVTFASSGTTVIGIDSSMATRTIDAGALTVMAPFDAQSIGTTSVTIASTGLPTLTVPVAVRAAELEVSDTELTLLDTEGSNGGECVLLAPDGLTWATFSAPTGTSSFLTVSGVGTSRLTLTFEDGVQRSMTSIECDHTFSGSTDADSRVRVYDSLHGSAYEVNYVYEVALD